MPTPIHALLRSATPKKLVARLIPYHISIHALPRSATGKGHIEKDDLVNFNSCTHAECNRLKMMINTAVVNISIHALTQSATSRKEAMEQIGKHISIHALPRSATVLPSPPIFLSSYFNSCTPTECN